MGSINTNSYILLVLPSNVSGNTVTTSLLLKWKLRVLHDKRVALMWRLESQ